MPESVTGPVKIASESSLIRISLVPFTFRIHGKNKFKKIKENE